MSDDKLRQKILSETSRLMREGREPQLGKARFVAARSVTKSWVAPADFPSDYEVRGHLFREVGSLQTPPAAGGSHDAARFDHYRSLLEPLAHVLQSPQQHPEGDALYHSLQVFALITRESPWDEELQLAALLHDVGKGIDPLKPVAAGLAALDGWVTERTAWLIGNHADAQRLHARELGTRALRRLSEHPDFTPLLLLARCDREGRVPGAQVPTLSAALVAIQQLAEFCDGEDDPVRE
jgi:hypothetical protein